eukprot:TRINITY_DN2889_c0_g1_i3.p2 TRINITY_DN2889_c0_g1~~TRINITY_DN2889_c0_g1_i3.p2  ORF type:complete len:191 (-),score=49.41 TRINITY_DN2889_c0_g1_i3:19-591(-)
MATGQRAFTGGSGDVSVKVLLVGAAGVGKTTVANHLAGQSRFASCSPTVGLRIVEFDREVAVERGTQTLLVALWDCSGDRKYEYTWPALMQGADGILFMYNPQSPNTERELENWYAKLAAPIKLADQQCMIFAHTKSAEDGPEARGAKPKLSKALQRVPAVATSLTGNPKGVQEAFDKLIAGILAAKQKM